jgi:hypothetical protein
MEKVFIVFALLPLAVQLAIAQHAPNDSKILHDVNAALENERAFRGLLIVPKVSHGIVTLTGTVSSEVLASIEVGQGISCAAPGDQPGVHGQHRGWPSACSVALALADR